MSRQFVIADDHALFRAGLRLFLTDACGPAEVREAGSLPELKSLLEANSEVDLAVVDLAMPGMKGAASIRELRHAYPQLRCVVMSGSEQRQDVLDALAAGVIGYIPKSLDPEAMVAAIPTGPGRRHLRADAAVDRTAEDPEPSSSIDANVIAMLTPRQYDVLRLLGKGQANKEIARALDISEGTVNIHLAAIFRLLDVRNRTEAVLKASALDI